MTSSKYAKTILTAMTIRENSWDSYVSEYTKSDYVACIQACKLERLSENLALPMSLSFYWWNDLADWANREVL